jgi:hypothetical protein
VVLRAAWSRAVIPGCACSYCYFEKDAHADASKIEIGEMGILPGSQISMDSGLSDPDSGNRIHFCSSERRAFLLAAGDGRRALVVLLRLGLFDPRT